MYIIYGLGNCGYCSKAVSLLHKENVQFNYYPLDNQEGILEYMKNCYNHKTVPIIVYSHNGEESLIGGYDDLVKYFRKQKDKESNRIDS